MCMQRCIIGRPQVYIQSNVNKWSRLAGFKDIKSSVCVTVVISSHMLLTAHCSLDHLSILGDQLHPSCTRAEPEPHLLSFISCCAAFTQMCVKPVLTLYCFCEDTPRSSRLCCSLQVIIEIIWWQLRMWTWSFALFGEPQQKVSH